MTTDRPAAPAAARGNALAPVLLVFGALALSALVFFLFTRKKIEDSRRAAPAETAATAPEPARNADPKNPDGRPAAKAAPNTQPGQAATQPAKSPMPAAPAGPPPVARPIEVAEQLARLLGAGDLANAAKMIAPQGTPQQDAAQGVLDKIFRELGYKAGPPTGAQMIGQVEDLIRVAVPLASPKPGAPPARLLLDLERDPRRGWRVAQIHLPKELEAALAALPSTPPPANAPAPGAALPSISSPGGAGRSMNRSLFVVDQGPDALTFASDFVTSLLKLDYVNARRFVDPGKVPPVKLAALCIVFEEGQYRLADDRALVATVATDSTSWVITRVSSARTRENTEFGLEMEKSGSEWRVGGLNLSKLLSDNARVNTPGEVPYSPLVMNPKGGESIALFFEYDRAELHPRAQKQLDIVADILKASPAKKLRISGFTDAKGTEDYNLGLSRRRAEAVKQYFLSHGVPIEQVETSGLGKDLPLSPNVNPDGTDNPEGRSRNRRAEILLDF